jgi:RecB family exonuclease
MQKRPLSASSIKTFLQCVLKYYYRYEDKKPRGGRTAPLAFGSAVHEALEFMHGEVSKTGTSPDEAMYERTLNVFMESATKNNLDDLALFEEGRNMLISRLDNVDPEENVIGLELRFELETPNGTPFLGSIDKLIELDPETVVIIDYKTSRTALTQGEADTDIQLSMYDYAVSKLYPQYKTIISALDYLRLSDVVTHRTPEQRKMFESFLDAVYKNILEVEKDDVEANINTFCPWCDARTFCPKYKALVSEPDLVLAPLGELEDSDFVTAWDVTSSAKRIVDYRQRELKAVAAEKMKHSKNIVSNGRELYRTQQSRMSYDPKTVFNIVGQDEYVRMSNVNKSAVDRFSRDNPEHSAELEDKASFSFMSPSFRIRNTKDKG